MQKLKRRQYFKYICADITIHLYCAICKDVFYKPIRTECGHTFCGECIMHWFRQKQTCPQCRQRRPKNFKYDKDNVAQQIVEDYEVKCLRCEDWVGPLKHFKHHLKESCPSKLTFDSPEYEDGQLIDLSDLQQSEEAEIQEYDPAPLQQVPIAPTSQKIKKYKLKLKQPIKVQDELVETAETLEIPLQEPKGIEDKITNENDEIQNIHHESPDLDVSTQEHKANYHEDHQSPIPEIDETERDQQLFDQFVEYCMSELAHRLAIEYKNASVAD